MVLLSSSQAIDAGCNGLNAEGELDFSIVGLVQRAGVHVLRLVVARPTASLGTCNYLDAFT
jgi:hypothetical protein